MRIHFAGRVLGEAVFIVHHGDDEGHDPKDEKHKVGDRDVHDVDALEANDVRVNHMDQIG